MSPRPPRLWQSAGAHCSPAVGPLVLLALLAAAGCTPGGGTSGSVLTPAQQAQITQEGGKDAKKLEELATSPAFGAPQSRPKADENTPVVKPEGALSAAVSAVGDGSDGRLIGLFVALVAITAAALGLAAARRQRSV